MILLELHAPPAAMEDGKRAGEEAVEALKAQLADEVGLVPA